MKLTTVQIVPRMNVGGVERGVLDLAGYFKSRMNTIVISGGGMFINALEQTGARHYTLPVYKKSLFTLRTIPQLRTIMEREHAHIVHARSRVPAWVAFFATRNSTTYFVTTCHGVYSPHIFSAAMGWGKFVICPSNAVARHMKKHFHVPDDKIVVINRWVDLVRFSYQPYSARLGNSTIICMGRIAPSKGYEFVIEALKKLVRINPYLMLKIIGTPDASKIGYYHKLKSLVSRHGLEYNVTFLGSCSAVEQELAQARMLIAPSVEDESFGRVIIEAFSCGVPVIATRVAGYAEIIENGKDGLLVEPAHAQALADAAAKLLKDDDLAASLAASGRAKAETLYSIEKNLEATEAVYQRALSFQRILIIKISSLGDIILALPSFKALKDNHPNGHIAILVARAYAPILAGCPFIDEIIPLDDTYKSLPTFLRASALLRNRSFDYIFDLQNSRTSHMIAFLSFPRFSFGYAIRWGALLSKTSAYQRLDTPLQSQERVLALAGISLRQRIVPLWHQAPREYETVLKKNPCIGIVVRASNRWQTKNWPLRHIAQLLTLIRKHMPSYTIVLLGDTHAMPLAQRLERLSEKPLINTCGKTHMQDMAGIIGSLHAIITPDTAALHIAAAYSTRIVALFGPTDPARHTPETSRIRILCKKQPCSHCYKPLCKNKASQACMTSITPQEVLAQLTTLLEHT